MTLQRRMKLAFKALHQLGPRKVFHYLIYKTGVLSGLYKKSRKRKPYEPLPHKKYLTPSWFWKIPNLQKPPAYLKSTFQETVIIADQICKGKTNLFGALESKIALSSAKPLHHWTYYDTPLIVKI